MALYLQSLNYLLGSVEYATRKHPMTNECDVAITHYAIRPKSADNVPTNPTVYRAALIIGHLKSLSNQQLRDFESYEYKIVHQPDENRTFPNDVKFVYHRTHLLREDVRSLIVLDEDNTILSWRELTRHVLMGIMDIDREPENIDELIKDVESLEVVYITGITSRVQAF